MLSSPLTPSPYSGSENMESNIMFNAPVKPPGFPALLEAARQQTELVCWVARALEDHEARLVTISQRIADLEDVKPAAQPAGNAHRWNWLKNLARAGEALEHPGQGDADSDATGEAADGPTKSPTPPPGESADKASLERQASGGNATDAMVAQVQSRITSQMQSHMLAMANSMEELSADVDRRFQELKSYADKVVDRKLEPIKVRATMSGASVGNVNSEQLDNLIKDGALKAAEETMEKFKEEMISLISPSVDHDGLQDELEHGVKSAAATFVGAQEQGRLSPDKPPSATSEVDSKLSQARGETPESVLLGDSARSTPALGLRKSSSPDPRLVKAMQEQKQLAANEHLLSSIRMFAADVNRRLPKVEEELTNLKTVRLKMPVLESDLDELARAVTKLTQQANSPRSDSDDDDHNRPATGAHDITQRRPTQASLSGRRSSVNAMQAYFVRNNSGLGDDDSGADNLQQRLSKLEDDRTGKKIADIERLVAIFEDRLKALDADYRVYSKKMELRLDKLRFDQEALQEDDRHLGKTWNLAHQVDVIQSLIAQEMTNVRKELDHAVLKALVDRDKRVVETRDDAREGAKPLEDKARTNSDEASIPAAVHHDFEAYEEKVKKLQECYQQLSLKIAGLKSSTKNHEAVSHSTTEKLKRLSDDLEQLSELAHRQECRWEYFAQHSPRGVEPVSDIGGNFQHHPEHAPTTPSSRRTSGALLARKMSSGAITSGLNNPMTPTGPNQRRQIAQAKETSGTLDSLEDVNTIRIGKVGKKLNEMEAEIQNAMNTLRGEVEHLNRRCLLITGFLPKRPRRLVERIMQKEVVEKDKPPKDKEHTEGSQNAETQSSKAKVRFNEGVMVESRTYEVVDEEAVPWQMVGEPDQKWMWLYQARAGELGRELARHFEQMEEEKQEFEKEVAEAMEKLREELHTKASVGTLPGLPMHLERHALDRHATEAGAGDAGAMSSSVKRKASFKDPTPDMSYMPMQGMVGRIEKVVMPQMASMEDRIDRLVADFQEHKKNQEVELSKKVDKDEYELIAMRVTAIDKADPPATAVKVETLEREAKVAMSLVERITEQLRKLESTAASRLELTKCRSEVSHLKAESARIRQELKDTSSAVYSSNREMGSMMLEIRSQVDASTARADKDKVTPAEHAALLEKVTKLEAMMRDNRRILSDAGGGGELSAVVKRIILNMEDKMMLIEKKVDALAESIPGLNRDVQRDFNFQQRSVTSPSAVSHTDSVDNAPQEFEFDGLTDKLADVSQAVHQLKQELNVTKVDMEHIMEQGLQAEELAQRLKVVVEGVSSTSADEGTTLSLNRVQVMISAAARQLVAGSKWVTKDMFDSRVAEVRKEYMSSTRQLQTSVDEIFAMVAKLVAPAAKAGQLTRLPRVVVENEKPQSGKQQIAVSDPEASAADLHVASARAQRDQRPLGTAPASLGTGGLTGMLPSARQQQQQTPRRPESERRSGRLGGQS